MIKTKIAKELEGCVIMFREMRRKKQLLSKEETIEILKSCTSEF